MNNKKTNILLFINLFLLTGCNNEIFNPAGYIAKEQIKLVFIAFFLMLIVVIPVIIMSLFFFKKYNEKNNSQYYPNWSYSNKIEIIIWFFPILIILFLSIITWHTTHKLEPSNTIIAQNNPIEIQVISFDWKWLFIYPNQKIATVNQIVFPINTPIIFKITSNSVMNSFFIPSLGSQIYAMSGMQTKLNLISNKTGIFKGFSSNFSGKGFSNMKFQVIVTKNHLDFFKWIKIVQSSSKKLITLKDLKKFSSESINNPIELFSSVAPNLFNEIINFNIQNKYINLY